MKFKNFIIFTLTFLIYGCDGSYQSNDEDMIYEIDPFLKSGGFVSVGEVGTILTSSDGTTWTSRNSGSSRMFKGIIYGSNIFVVGNNGGEIFSSNDGISWTLRFSNSSYEIEDGDFGDDLFLFGTNTGKIIKSSNSLNWDIISSDAGGVISDIAYFNK